MVRLTTLFKRPADRSASIQLRNTNYLPLPQIAVEMLFPREMLFAEDLLKLNEIRPFERFWIAVVSTTGIKRTAPCRLESEPKRRRISSPAKDSTCAEEMEEVENNQQQANAVEQDAMVMDHSP